MAAETTQEMAPSSFSSPFRNACWLGQRLNRQLLPLEEDNSPCQAQPSRGPLSRLLTVRQRPREGRIQNSGFKKGMIGKQYLLSAQSNTSSVSQPPSICCRYGLRFGEATPELRRVSSSYADLRAIAQRQAEPSSSLSNPFPPSPWDFSDLLQSTSTEFDSIEVSSDKDSGRDRGHEEPDLENYSSYEDLRILSCYCEDTGTFSPILEGQNLQHLPYNRSTTCSTESKWFADTKPHDERLKRFRQRCYQVVEHPITKSASAMEDGENEIMIATMVPGPGKPRLIQIRRPLSKFSSQSLSSPKMPQKHAQKIPEISAFSPSDAPSRWGSRDSSFEWRRSCSSNSLSPSPLSYSSQTRVDSAVSVQSKHRRGPPNFRKSKSQSEWTGYLAFVSSRSQGICRVGYTFTAEQTLKEVADATASFPERILYLESCLIRALRRSNQADEDHIFCLSKIFPATPRFLLSALAAWLLIDTYLIELETELQFASYPDLAKVPEKARVMLGITASHFHWQEHIFQRTQVVRVKAAGIAQRLLEAIRGSWDEDLWKSLRVLIEIVEAAHS